MRIVVDRIEGKFAVLEVGEQTIDFPLAALPDGAKEGSVLAFVVQSADDLLAEAEARLERLRERDPGGDTFDL